MGAIIQFNGHEMIYLGESGGKFYTINDVSSLKNPENIDGAFQESEALLLMNLA